MMKIDEATSKLCYEILFEREAVDFDENMYIWDVLQDMKAEIIRLTDLQKK